MKLHVGERVVVVIGGHGALPPLLPPDADRREMLVLALGPRLTPEQQRAVEEAVGVAVEHRIPFEARIVDTVEAAAIVAASSGEGLRAHGCSRRELRSLGLRLRR